MEDKSAISNPLTQPPPSTDIAVRFSGMWRALWLLADPVRLWEAGEAIARRLDVDVDLIDLRAASTVMQFEIVTTGRRLFAQGGEADCFELVILGEMMDLNRARAPLIADIQREGRVHGR